MESASLDIWIMGLSLGEDSEKEEKLQSGLRSWSDKETEIQNVAGVQAKQPGYTKEPSVPLLSKEPQPENQNYPQALPSVNQNTGGGDWQR